MAAIAKIIFPAPPQTTNALSYQDRQQLMRSTKKLGRVLGITPQLIDIYPSGSSSSSSLTEWSDDDDFDIPKRRGSVDSLSSGSSYNTQSRSRWSSRPSSRQQSRTTSPASRSSLSTSPVHQDSWLTSDAKPLLRLAMSSPLIDVTLGSPNAESMLSSDDEVESNAGDLRYTIRPRLSEPSRDSFLSVPDFQIPSTKSLRLAKMDRIRKKLGDDVPIHLVFPDGDEEDSATDCSSTDSYASVTIHWRPLPAIPKDETLPTSATFPSHTHTRTKLSNARDSILVQNSRQAHKIKRKPVPKFDSLEELALNSLSIDVERRKAKERLSLILELPHEHDDNSDLLTVEFDDSSSPISTWFSDGADMDCYQNFLNYETATD